MKNDGIGILLENNNKYLLLLRTNDEFWECPKGHLDSKEEDEDTIRRELKEETGISKVDIKEKIGVLSFEFTKNDKTKRRNINYYYATTSEKKVELSPEHQDYAWLEKEEFLDRLKFDDIKNLLKSFFDKEA